MNGSHSKATPEGTQRPLPGATLTASSRARRPLGRTGLWVSSFGMGCYRLRAKENHPEHTDALRQAILQGCNLFDIAPHYGKREAEETLGLALEWAMSEGFKRDQFVLLGRVACPGVQESFAPGHESPFALDSMRTEILESCRRLSVTQLDGVFLHQPERLWHPAASLSENLRRWVAALKSLEQLRAEGLLQYYGISSSFFLKSPADTDSWIPLEGLVEAFEKEVGPRIHSGFHLIGAPLNLLESEAVLAPHQPGGLTLSEAVERCGMALLTHRPLNALQEGEILRFAAFPSFDLERAQENLALGIQGCLALEGDPTRPEKFPRLTHAIQRELKLFKDPGAWREALQEKILPTLETWRERLLQGKDEQGIRDLHWYSQYMTHFPGLLTALTRLIEGSASLRSQRFSQLLESALPRLAPAETLSSRSLHVLESLPGPSAILIGMRSPRYVAEALKIRPLLPVEEALDVLYAFQADRQAMESKTEKIIAESQGAL